MAALGSGGDGQGKDTQAQSATAAPGQADRAPQPASRTHGSSDARDVDAWQNDAAASPRDLPGSPRRIDDDVFTVRTRPRASPLRVLAIIIASILVTAVLFRAAVEGVRAFVAG